MTFILPESDVDRVLEHVQDAIWCESEEHGVPEDDALDISDRICDQVRSILTQEMTI